MNIARSLQKADFPGSAIDYRQYPKTAIIALISFYFSFIFLVKLTLSNCRLMYFSG